MKDAEYIESAAHFSNYTDCSEYVTISLGKFADEFDIEAIVDEVFDFVPSELCWQCDKDEDEYWEIVQRHDISEQ